MFCGDCSFEINWKCVGQIGSLQILTSEKCTVPLKKGMAASIQEIITVHTAERITETMDDMSVPLSK